MKNEMRHTKDKQQMRNDYRKCIWQNGKKRKKILKQKTFHAHNACC